MESEMCYSLIQSQRTQVMENKNQLRILAERHSSAFVERKEQNYSMRFDYRQEMSNRNQKDLPA